MKDLEIKKKDISELKEFTFDGTILRYMETTPEGWYIYERLFKTGGRMGFEVVRPKKVKNPDGTVIYKYPSSSEFGYYGLYFPRTMTKEDILKRCKLEWGRLVK